MKRDSVKFDLRIRGENECKIWNVMESFIKRAEILQVIRTTKTQYCSHKCSSRAYKQAARREKLEIAKVG